jgi:NADH:ubiquinone oxidoreductase subunit 5 (subunit L)/multisubunit Na+/H+ antiporter MnhA subunit
VVLTLLAILIAALLGLAIAAVTASQHVVALGTAMIGGVVVFLVLAWLAVGGEATSLSPPIGTPGSVMHIVLDPLGAAFLLLLFVPAIPCAVYAAVAPDAGPAATAGLPLSLAAMMLTVLASDTFCLVLGLAGMGMAGWLLLAPRPDAGRTAKAAQSCLRRTVFAVVCLVVAFALMAPPAIPWLACDFAAIRAAPPEGWRAGAVFALTLSGAAGLAALLPVQAWIGRLGGASALLAGGGTTIGLYLLFRVLLDLCGSAQPLWWGVPLLMLGGACAVAGPLQATIETRLEPLLAIGSLHQTGLAVMGLGLALFAHAVDLPQMAALALGAAWLLLVTHALCRTLLLLCAGAGQRGAGTFRLDRMGGLIHGMPVTGRCALAGLLGAAMLPPGLGFAGFWLLFQALLAAFRIGGAALQLLIALAALAAALSVGLAALAAVRVAGVVFLGRPRTPRAAAAEEPPRALRLCLVGLAVLTGLGSVFPSLALLPAARGLARLANGSGLGPALTLRPGTEVPGYAPVVIASLLALAGYALLWLSRRRGPGHRREPAWSGGFAPPPPWLPFGDPTTQIGAASFADPLHRILASWHPWPAPPRAGALLASSRVRLRRGLRHVAGAVAAPGLAGSVAATLAVLVAAIAAWLVVQ